MIYLMNLNLNLFITYFMPDCLTLLQTHKLTSAHIYTYIYAYNLSKEYIYLYGDINEESTFSKAPCKFYN